MRKKQRRFFEKHYRSKMSIRGIASGLRDSFDKAYGIAKTTIEREKEKAKEDYNVVNEKLKDVNITEENPPSPETLDLFDEMGGAAYSIHSSEEALLALEEMRLVFMYKSVEIAIKDMVIFAFPNLDPKEMYRWDVVKSHLKANGISIGELTGFQETNALRIINNNIKHSPDLTQESKNCLSCWRYENEFTAKNLELFCEDIKPKVIQFMECLGEAIIKSAYDFDDSKLEAIAAAIHEKLDREQVIELIEKLRTKYNFS
jgi:hypothetical protein